MSATGMAVSGSVVHADASDAPSAHGLVSTAPRGAQRLDPAASLSMIYLREFERTHSTMRGKVRIARKAGHMLRMHWAHVRAGTINEIGD